MKFLPCMLCIILSILILGGCVPGIYEYLNRPLEDPEITKPRTISFKQELTVIINWDADERCDEFILYRRQDSAFAVNEIVYRGTGTRYMDTNGINEDRYLYSLSKIRGSREFGPSDPAFGVFSHTLRDFLEPNNTQEDAVRLEYEFGANMYYYRNSAGDEVKDTDWFYVEIPYNGIATIVVNQEDLEFVDTFFYFSQVGEVPFQVVDDNEISIKNYSAFTDRFYFKLYPVPSAFLNDISEAGGTIVNYTISLKMISFS